MSSLVPVLAALLGLALSPLLNALADHLPQEGAPRRAIWSVPLCPHCGEPYGGVYRLALARLLARGGHCLRCGQRIGAWRALGVELISMLAGAGLWLWASAGAGSPAQVAGRLVAGATLVYCCLVIGVIDIEHRLIPRRLIYPAAALVAVASLLLPGRTPAKTLLGGLAGYGIFLAIYLLAGVYGAVVGRLRGRPLEEVAMGGGDVNLAGLVGLAVGWPGVLIALAVGIVAGGAFSLGIIAIQLARRRYSPHSAYPYGPFLILGGLAVFFYGKELADWWLGR